MLYIKLKCCKLVGIGGDHHEGMVGQRSASKHVAFKVTVPCQVAFDKLCYLVLWCCVVLCCVVLLCTRCINENEGVPRYIFEICVHINRFERMSCLPKHQEGVRGIVLMPRSRSGLSLSHAQW